METATGAQPARAQVLVVGTLRPTVGGIATAIEDQVGELRRRGIAVDVFNTGASRRPRPGRLNFANATDVIAAAWRLLIAMRRVRPRVADIHTTGSPLLPLLRCLVLVIAARLGGAACVVHIHAYDLDRRAGGRAMSVAARLLGRLVARVVVLDRSAAAALARLAPGMRTVIIPNGVDCAYFCPSPPAAAARVAFVGTVGRRKGVFDLVAAAARENLAVDIVGGPGEEDSAVTDEIRATAVSAGASGVVFHGELDRDRVRAVLRGARVFALPSRAEGLPVALLEALACGLPVVVTEAGAMGEILSRSGCGVVVPEGDVVALTEALTRVLRNTELRADLSARARQTALTDFDIRGTVAALLDVYAASQPGLTAVAG